MTVRRLRKNQLGPWCSYCTPKTTRAVHRGCYFSKFACSEHFADLKKDDDLQTRMENYQTEGERQALRNY